MTSSRCNVSRRAVWLGMAVMLSSSAAAMAIGPFHGGYCPPCDQSGDAMAGEDNLPPVMGAESTEAEPSDALAGAGTADVASASFGHVPTYIDNAIPMNLLRVRYDNFTGANRPDRAEYLYPTYSLWGGPLIGDAPASDVDFQEISLYAEYMMSCETSVFVDVPFRFVDYSVLNTPGPTNVDNQDNSGIGDIRFGFKHVLRENCCGDYLTAQLRVFVPSGDASQGLGTDHFSIEPALLFHKNMSCGFIFGELKDWIAIDGTTVVPNAVDNQFVGDDFSGNVLEYGIGHGYDVWTSCCCESRLTLLNEFVGWTVLDGLVSAPADDIVDADIADASGDTIVNWKVSLRYTKCQRAITASYGTNLTDDRWYSDIFRLQYEYNY